MLVIGFGHRARQGKNTAAVAMMNAAPIGHGGRICAFADELRREVIHEVNLAGGVQEFIDKIGAPSWVHAEPGGAKQRTLLQWYGTNYRRAQDPNYWVGRLQARLQFENPPMALITDVRFPNECEAVHAMGGYLVKVVRTTPPDVDVPPHPSECALDGYTGWDYTLTAATLPELRAAARALYAEIAKRGPRAIS